MTRLGYTAELGYELWVDESRALELWDALLEALEPQGMRIVGMVALDLFRIEGGFIIGGIEYDATVSPYECGLGWAVDLEKGEFQGREALSRAADETSLRLTTVELESGGDKASGARLFVDGEEVGLVTQAVESPYRDGATVGLAKIRKDLREPGRKVEARTGDRPSRARSSATRSTTRAEACQAVVGRRLALRLDPRPRHDSGPTGASGAPAGTASRLVSSSCQASERTSPRIPTISSNSACPAIRGGETWTTGSPRSSARQMRPRSKSFRTGSRAGATRLSSSKVSRVSCP